MSDKKDPDYEIACAKCGSWDIDRINLSTFEKLFARNKYSCRSCSKTSYGRVRKRIKPKNVDSTPFSQLTELSLTEITGDEPTDQELPINWELNIAMEDEQSQSEEDKKAFASALSKLE